jgi:hypothetical protein
VDEGLGWEEDGVEVWVEGGGRRSGTGSALLRRMWKICVERSWEVGRLGRSMGERRGQDWGWRVFLMLLFREREREAILDRRVVAEDEEMSRMMTWRKARLLRRRCLLHRQL